MTTLFNFGRAIGHDFKREQTAEDLRLEVANFKLAGTGGFLSIVKYLCFAILGSLNFHLFYSHLPGIWGVGLGAVAILFECCTIYFWNSQNWSAGSHQRALQAFAVIFTVASFVHGSAALYQLAGVGPSLHLPLEIYSKFLAFPLLFGLMVLAVCVLHYVHWQTRISEAQAETQLRAARSRAELITEAVDLENKAQIETERLHFLEKKLVLEEQYVSVIEKFVAIKSRGQRALDRIEDPDVRREINAALGRTTTELPAPRRIAPLPSSIPAAVGDNDPK